LEYIDSVAELRSIHSLRTRQYIVNCHIVHYQWQTLC